MDLAKAFEIVLDLAEQNQMTMKDAAEDPDLLDQVMLQEEAIDLVGAFIISKL